MGIVKDIRLGLRSYIGAVKFVAKHNMWAYLIIPVILFGGIYYFGFKMEENESLAKQSMSDASFFVYIWNAIKWIFFLAMSWLSLQLTRYIMLMLLSPLLAITSEKVEKVLTGNVYKLNLKQLWKDVRRAVRIAFRNMVYEICFVLIINFAIWSTFWIFGASDVMVPVLNLTVVSFLQLIITSLMAFYFYGFGFLDYVMERRRLTVKESIKFVRKHKGVAIALGSLFVLLFHSTELVSGMNFSIVRTIFLWVTALLASIIPIFTAVAATLAMHDLVDLSTNEFALKKTPVEAAKEVEQISEAPPTELPGDL